VTGQWGRKTRRRRARRPTTPISRHQSRSNPNPGNSRIPQAQEASTLRLLTSSCEVGTLRGRLGSSSSAGVGSGAYLGVGGVAQKKHSILGFGLPSTFRLPTVRSGSTTSSVLVGGANTVGPSFGAPTAAAAFSVNNNKNAANDNRLSVDSALNNPATSPRPSYPPKRLLSRFLSPSYIHHVYKLTPLPREFWCVFCQMG
jgi:hypothetical protein